jgi:hypothetical protein
VNGSPAVTQEYGYAQVSDLVGDLIYGTDTLLDQPQGIAVDSGGNIYVTNYGGPLETPPANNSITVYPPLLAGSGTENEAPTVYIAGSNTELDDPVGIALDSAGDIYVVNQAGYDAKTAVYTAPSITVYPPVPSGDLTGDTTVTLNESPVANIPLSIVTPGYIALDQNLNIYVTNLDNNQFLVYPPVPSADLTGNTNVTLSGTPTATVNGVGLDGVTGIVVDTSGNIYVANISNGTVTIYQPLGSSTGTLTPEPIATIGGQHPGFVYAYGLALDAYGHLFVADNGTGLVSVFPQLGSSTGTLNEYPLATLSNPSSLYDVAAQPAVIYPTTTPTPTPTPTPCTSGICGQVVGGLTPISGSAVTLYAAGTGYGTGASSIGTATTAGDGTFTVSSYTCPGGNPQTYITALGGNSNSAIGLMAALGPCNSLSTSTNVTINELTTAAADWALAQFFDSSGHTIGAPSTNATGLQNAYTNLANLAAVNATNLSVSGNPSSFLPSPAPVTCGGQFPLASCVNNDGLKRLDTLANILAGCVESSGPSSTACVKLLCDATPGDLYGTSCATPVPTITDTLGAAHLIVTNPANNVGALYGLAGTAAFSPTLGSAPDGWEMGLNFNSVYADFDDPYAVALDASGNVFALNCGEECGGDTLGSVSELTASSGYATALNLGGGDFYSPESLAVDTSGNLFAANAVGYDANSVTELTFASSPPYSTDVYIDPSGADFSNPLSLTLDASGDLFVANYGNSSDSSVSEVTPAPTYGTGHNFTASGAAFDGPNTIAVDGSGNVFVSNQYGGPDEYGSVSELTAASTYGTGKSFTSTGAFGEPEEPDSIALDGSANVFTANYYGNSVSELTATSTYATGKNFTAAGAALDEPEAIVVDGSGNVFVSNETGSSNSGSVSELTASSNYGTGLNFAPAGAAFNAAGSLALDSSGNVFVTNEFGQSVSEIMGLAKPVITPIQACTIFWKNNPGQACVP